ncbi:toll/interleukin-1 receptor domain-containing protein [Mucilaginibacter celer]|uniref:TIR domain-containing protein n=1 Tax=Mucilaginibacter celer TaxID=2305508 RepID=A0A494VKA0_9SPHI|nr:toll/interleukin-1 receptor domain-containing protein [Mucilaginibacter celer]AYL93851.1 TIR domain-containing protein [Mucilaginibacter celer]
MQNLLTEILAELKQKRCVLVIGPELGDHDEPSFFERLCEALPRLDFDHKSLDGASAVSEYTFLNEELIQIKAGTEPWLSTLVKWFYEEQTWLDEPLRKISQIPFSMIISLMPDGRLKRIFDEQQLPYTFNYCPIDKVRPVTETTSADAPLIYHLIGNLEEKEVVLTFENMFALLKNVLKNDLPTVVQKTLAEAKSVVFLGVRYERWHTQLLLRYIKTLDGINVTITKDTKLEKDALGKKSVENDQTAKNSSVFVRNRLNLGLLNDNPIGFLDRLYDCCRQQNLLKQPQVTSYLASIFLSYSHENKMIADDLADRLRRLRMRVIMDETDLRTGQNIKKFIDEIEQTDAVVALISRNSIFSPYVIEEIAKACELEKTLLPVSLDNILDEPDLEQQKDNRVESVLQDIRRKLRENLHSRMSHLWTEHERWADFDNSFSSTLTVLKNNKRLIYQASNPQATVTQLLRDILSLNTANI